jgi:gamma-glutamyltranspeptidase / glutathione hydrolase
VDWWTTLMIASVAADLRRYSASAAAYLQDGLPPNVERPPAAGKVRGHPGPSGGAGVMRFLRGRFRRSIAADVQAGGGALLRQR